ncbi:diacylglycerol lipase-alpha-like [Diadema antillarum]|uniref:diacylglycerol lipase-alpha-like n=1 Tax=Diadema antillarum TaxID=105358 RepID=UPI003A88D9BB
MPGLIALGRRWSVGSDDLVIPSTIFLVIHVVWTIILICVVSQPHEPKTCSSQLFLSIVGYLVLQLLTIVAEVMVTVISLRGTILYVRPRQHMKYVLYVTGVLYILSLLWSMISIHWLVGSYTDCTLHYIKQTVLGLIIFHFVVFLTLCVLLFCVWDGAGRSFVKLKKTEKERNIKRTASRVERNQQRELRTRAKYEQNWDKRLRFWFCCTSSGEIQESAFADIAILFSEFFRDLDVVPSDILAGLMLLREEQKQRREAIENSPQNSVFRFLSGVAVTPETKFLDFHKAEDSDLFEELHHYFKFAAAAYGWKGYVMVHGAGGCCTMAKECRCCCFKSRQHYHLDESSDPDADNCCMCNFAALKKMSGLGNNDIIYATFHVSVSCSSCCQGLGSKEESTGTESYGIDTEGLMLVGRTSPRGVGPQAGGANEAGATPNVQTPESGICLKTSLSFQEEMDERMMRKEARSAASLSDDGSVSCGGRFCSCLPPSLSPCSSACSESGVASAGSVSSLSQSDNLVWETPFFVALDHDRRRVVVSIRGTLSVADIVTDLSADTSPIHTEDGSMAYKGHKGMVETANYIRRRLVEDKLLHQAFTAMEVAQKGTSEYELVLVGHSLGAGTAAILGIMLRPRYPTLKVYAYSPPGGLLCKEASEYAAEFVTSLIVGKDVVARIGLSQMEFLRADLLNCIKMCRDPKWRVIFGELLCCCSIRSKNLAPIEDADTPSPLPWRLNKAFHPTNHELVLTTHSPLYLPGRILQVVRNNPKREGISKKECAYYAIWRDREDFNEVLISPVIINDHLPGGVKKAVEKCLEYGKRHGLPKRFSQVGRTPMHDAPQYQDHPHPAPVQTPSSSSQSSYLQMKPVKTKKEKSGGAAVHFQDSPTKSSPSTKSWRSGVKAPESNNNQRPFTELVSAEDEQLPFLPHSTATQNIPDDAIRTSRRPSDSHVPKISILQGLNCPSEQGSERLAPLASSESFTDCESPRSSISSMSFSSVLNRFQNPSSAREEGYCYYVENESQPAANNMADSEEDLTKQNTVTTTATIESSPSNHVDHDASPTRPPSTLIGPWSLFRGGNGQVIDEEGNVKGRTSASDRYTLTYDGMDLDPATGSEGGTDSPRSSRPHSIAGGRLSTAVREAKLGQAYTEYLPIDDDDDDDFDDEVLFSSLNLHVYENPDRTRKSLTLPVGGNLSMAAAQAQLGSQGNRPLRKGGSFETVTSSTPTPLSSRGSPSHKGESEC